MKRASIIVLVMLSFLGCSKKDELDNLKKEIEFKLSKDVVNLANIQGSATINVTSAGDWHAVVENGAEWISLTPSSGKGNGPIRISVSKNTLDETRKGKVKVTQDIAGTTLSKELEVNQLGADPDILIEYAQDEIPFEGGELVVNVTANIDWDVAIDTATKWIKIKPEAITKVEAKVSAVTKQCTLIISPNADVKRSAKVLIRAKGGYVLNRTVQITQKESVAFLSVPQDEFIIPYRYETLSIPVDLGQYATKYTISADQDWVTWDEKASTSKLIVLKVKENNLSDLPRTVNINIKNVTLNAKVAVFQYGKPNPRIGDDISSAVLAFPGAAGGGRFTTGGRGGIVYRVTNLKDYAKGQAVVPGSLRYGLDMNVPRVIVFDVSGTIELTRTLGVVQPNVSILGQTAPGDGITLKNYQLEIGENVNNVIVRFIRCRTGDAKSDHEDDGISGRWFKDGIIDHVSSSWSVDETMSFYGVKNFTTQWSIAAESLNESQHAKGAHGYGGMFSGDNSSMHHILMMHHGSRNPRISDIADTPPTISNDYRGYFDVRNNVYYNWSADGQGAYGGKNCTFNLVKSYYKAGPATGNKAFRILSSDPSARIFADGNYATANASIVNDNWTTGIWNEFFHTLNPTEAQKQAMKKTEAFPFGKVTTHSPADAYQRVAEYAGASLRRDAVDKRYINEMLTGTTTYKGSISTNPKPGLIDKVSDTNGYPELKSLPAWPDTDGDGIPDIWEDAYGLNKNSAADAKTFTLDNMSRYSNLEVYLHNLVQHIVYNQNLGGTPQEKK